METPTMVYALNKCQSYLLGNKNMFNIDHLSLVHLINNPQGFGQISIYLYDFTTIYKPNKPQNMVNIIFKLFIWGITIDI